MAGDGKIRRNPGEGPGRGPPAARTGVAPRALARLFRRAGDCPVPRPVDSARGPRASSSLPKRDRAARRGTMAAKAKSGQTAAAGTKDAGGGGKRPNALQKPLQPSQELAAVVGPGPL